MEHSSPIRLTGNGFMDMSLLNYWPLWVDTPYTEILVNPPRISDQANAHAYLAFRKLYIQTCATPLLYLFSDILEPPGWDAHNVTDAVDQWHGLSSFMYVLF